MLVVSRGVNDRIVFPALGISVEVLKVKGSRTSLGVDAPRDIQVIRHELVPPVDGSPEESASSISESARKARHEFRNSIHRATLKLQLAAKHFEIGEIEQGLASMTDGMSELSAADQEARTELVPAHEMTLAESKATFASDGSRPRRILLVDDDANERVLMASYLERCGMEVEQAGDGLQALYSLSKPAAPDVVLLDMKMPNLDGPSTVRRIRTCSSHPNVPVFGVTGESIEHTGLTIADDCLNGWFQKPVQIDEIVQAILKCAVA